LRIRFLGLRRFAPRRRSPSRPLLLLFSQGAKGTDVAVEDRDAPVAAFDLRFGRIAATTFAQRLRIVMRLVIKRMPLRRKQPSSRTFFARRTLSSCCCMSHLLVKVNRTLDVPVKPWRYIEQYIAFVKLCHRMKLAA
jgi:hypothetical protein